MKTGMVILVTSLALVAAGSTAGLLLQHRNNAGPAYTTNPKYATRPQYTYATLASGDAGRVRLLTGISSETSQVGDAVVARLALPWMVDGRTVLPAGTRVSGQVTRAESTGRLKHNAKLSLRFDRLVLPGGERVAIVSRPLAFQAAGETKRDIISIGAGTVAGGVIGALTGNTERGVAIGAVAGTGAALYQKGDAVVLPAGSTLRLTLLNQLRVAVRKIPA